MDVKVQEQPSAVRVGDWLEARDPRARALDDGARKLERLKRQHGLQVALDVIAHVQNIPLRLLRLDRLVDLDKTLGKFLTDRPEDILQILTEAPPDGRTRTPRALTPDEARNLWTQMQDGSHLHTLRDWMLRLGDPAEAENPALLQRPASLPAGYVEWLLVLLPHLERSVWLTDMSNPLPAHNLARMVEHCSLYILMWAWSKATEFRRQCRVLAGQEPDPPHEDAPPTTQSGFDGVDAFAEREIAPDAVVIIPAMGFDHLGMCMLPAFTRTKREVASIPVALLAGPFRRVSDGSADAGKDDEAWYVEPLLTFLGRVERVQRIDGWDEVRDKAPGRTELRGAIASRAGIDDYEAQRRAVQSRSVLCALLNAHLDPTVWRTKDGSADRPISRANWETMAVLAAWYDRWGKVVFRGGDGAAPLVTIIQHRVKMLAKSRYEPLVFFAGDGPVSWTGQVDRRDLGKRLHRAREQLEWRWIEGPDTFFARMRERQQAAWAAQVAAVNNLLAGHSRRDRPVGADEPGVLRDSPASCEEVDHLLRGFGGKVCRYLLSLARADIAEMYWLDYSVDPPRLRHVGSAERLLEHRAKRQELYSAFAEKTAACTASSLGPTSDWLLYQAAHHGVTLPEDRTASASLGRASFAPRLDTYPAESRPEDAVAVPLLFNNRVVGVFGLAGMDGKRHFDCRLYPVLAVVAQLLAQTMYFQSQVWHMRQLNWLASQVPLEEWRKHERSNEFNPLKRAANCLANIFLCPGVQIWLRDEQNNPQRYKLHGNTAPEIFRDEKGEAHEHAPSLYVQASKESRTRPLARSVMAFAIDQYPDEQPDEPAAGNTASGVGRFVQSVFTGGPESTEEDYGLEAAERGDLQLHDDFLEAVRRAPTAAADDLPDLRRGIYEVRGWTQTMAFALLRTKDRKHDVIGVVALYAGRRDPRLGIATADKPSASGRRAPRHEAPRAPWPPGWRPVVAHVQTYLPYLLMQTEAIANPLDDMRRYLLHEGRNELNAVSIQAASLRKALQDLLEIDPAAGRFRARPWARQSKERIERDPSTAASNLLPGLAQLERALNDAAEKARRLMSVERGENIAMLGRLIERQRDLAALRITEAFSGRRLHDMRWVGLRDLLEAHFSAYDRQWRDLRVKPTVDSILENVQILTQPRLMAWLLGDLVHNMAKYTNVDSASVGASLSPMSSGKERHARLSLTNDSSYDPAVDIPKRLVEHGVQGSAGRLRHHNVPTSNRVSRVGQGIGLWGVNLLAEALHLGFEITIKPKSDAKKATYSFDLIIPADLVRSNWIQ